MKKSKKSGLIIGFFLVFAVVTHFIANSWLDRVESSCENAKCYLD
ncbi:MAG: hypothetical protein WBA54_12425 [Acidaminobacteraceae bacterium]